MNMEFLLLDHYKGRIRMTLEDAPPPNEPHADTGAKSGHHSGHQTDAGHLGHHSGHQADAGHDHQTGNKEGHLAGAGHSAGSHGHHETHSPGHHSEHAASHSNCHSPEQHEDQLKTEGGLNPKEPVMMTPAKDIDAQGGGGDDDDDESSPFPREFASRLHAELTIDGVAIPPVEAN